MSNPSVTDDIVARLLTVAGVRTQRLGTDDLRRVWSIAGGNDDVLFDDFLDAVAKTCPRHWDGPPVRDYELGLQIGQWRIDIGEHAVRAGLLTAFVAAVLVPQGLGEFTVAFVTAILPTVIEIERVELPAGDSRLLVELRLNRDIRNRSLSEDHLYDALPPETRQQINRYDFANFVQRLREGRFAEEDNQGLIRIWPE